MINGFYSLFLSIEHTIHFKVHCLGEFKWISSSCLHNLVKSGFLRVFQNGARIFVLADLLHIFLASCINFVGVTVSIDSPR